MSCLKETYGANESLLKVVREDFGMKGKVGAGTLQGWLKAINHPVAGFDPGNNKAPKDVFAEVLNYFDGDYNREGNGLQSTNITSPQAETHIRTFGVKKNDPRNLYNSNILSIVTYTAFDQVGQAQTASVQGIGYQYDQLNRLLDNVTVLKQTSELTDNTIWNNVAKDKSPLHEALSYDANGNIRNLNRFKEASPRNKPDVHELNYEYDKSVTLGTEKKKANNLLRQATGLPGQAKYDGNQPNYDYDAKGRMVQDLGADLGNYTLPNEQKGKISWTAYDKVKSITRNMGSTKANLSFTYDAMGNRLSKAVDVPNPTIVDYTSYYVYDASGNVMATYNKDGNLEEHYMYGSGRLGTIDPSVTATISPEKISFEVTDHLGNARAVITGQKKTTTLANIVQLKDYYSFGMVSRSFSAEKYRFGNYNGKEMDEETGWINYGYRNYNPVIGRFDRVDDLSKYYPELSNYQYASLNPILMNDLDGLEGIIYYHIKNKPVGFNETKFAHIVEAALIANGAHPDTKVKNRLDKSFFDQFKYKDNQSGSLIIRDYNADIEADRERSKGTAGYSFPNQHNSTIIFTGLGRNSGKCEPEWLYAMVALHELGHAMYGFEHDHDDGKEYREGQGIMGYRSFARREPNFYFRSSQMDKIKSKWNAPIARYSNYAKYASMGTKTPSGGHPKAKTQTNVVDGSTNTYNK